MSSSLIVLWLYAVYNKTGESVERLPVSQPCFWQLLVSRLPHLALGCV
jgi:hypothetical protein